MLEKKHNRAIQGGNVQGHRVGWGIQRDRPKGQVVGIFMLRPTNIHVYAPVSDSQSIFSRETSETSETSERR